MSLVSALFGTWYIQIFGSFFPVVELVVQIEHVKSLG